MEKKVSEKNTKKELLEAYQELLNAEKQVQSPEDHKEPVQTSSDQLPSSVSSATVSAAPILREIDDLRHTVGGMLERFGEQAASFEKRAHEEEEGLGAEMQRKRTEWKREQELYEYERGMKRRREEDEYALKTVERERQFSERFTAKERELREREERIKAAEEEIKQLHAQAERFPKELDLAVAKAAGETRAAALAETNVAKNLAAKDAEREQEIAKLKIHGLEDTITRQQTQITTLERELNKAHEQIQKLAVTVIESRTLASRAEEIHHSPAPLQQSPPERQKNQ